MNVILSTLLDNYDTLHTDIKNIISLHEDIFDQPDEEKLPQDIEKLIALIDSYSPAEALLAIKANGDDLKNALLAAKSYLLKNHAAEDEAKAAIVRIDEYCAFVEADTPDRKDNPQQYLKDYANALNAISEAIDLRYLVHDDPVSRANDAVVVQLARLNGVFAGLNNKEMIKIFSNMKGINDRLTAFERKLARQNNEIAMAAKVIVAIDDLIKTVAKILPFLV